MKNNISPISKLTFYHRAKNRMITAYFFLIISFAVLVYGAVQVITQLNELMSDSTGNVTHNYSSTEKEIKATLPEKSLDYHISNLLARLVLLSVIFYIANIFVRLYKYNMGASDYYRSCGDSLGMAQEFESKFLSKFESIFKTITNTKVEFEIPSQPKIELPSK